MTGLSCSRHLPVRTPSPPPSPSLINFNHRNMTRFDNKVSGVKEAAGLFHRRLCFLVMLVLWGLSCGSSLRAADPSALPEFQVKAAFLINFPKYVDWPAEAFAETNSPIVIAVLGESKVTDELEKGIAGRTI